MIPCEGWAPTRLPSAIHETTFLVGIVSAKALRNSASGTQLYSFSESPGKRKGFFNPCRLVKSCLSA